jgi:hypothetical protein
MSRPFSYLAYTNAGSLFGGGWRPVANGLRSKADVDVVDSWVRSLKPRPDGHSRSFAATSFAIGGKRHVALGVQSSFSQDVQRRGAAELALAVLTTAPDGQGLEVLALVDVVRNLLSGTAGGQWAFDNLSSGLEQLRKEGLDVKPFDPAALKRLAPNVRREFLRAAYRTRPPANRQSELVLQRAQGTPELPEVVALASGALPCCLRWALHWGCDLKAGKGIMLSARWAMPNERPPARPAESDVDVYAAWLDAALDKGNYAAIASLVRDAGIVEWSELLNRCQWAPATVEAPRGAGQPALAPDKRGGEATRSVGAMVAPAGKEPTGRQLNRQHKAIEEGLRSYLDRQIEDLHQSSGGAGGGILGILRGRSRQAEGDAEASADQVQPATPETDAPETRGGEGWRRRLLRVRPELYLAVALVALVAGLIVQTSRQQAADKRMAALEARLALLEPRRPKSPPAGRTVPAPAKPAGDAGGGPLGTVVATPPAVAAAQGMGQQELAQRWSGLIKDRARLAGLCDLAAAEEPADRGTAEQLKRLAAKIRKGTPPLTRSEWNSLERYLFEAEVLRRLPETVRGALKVDSHWNWENLNTQQASAVEEQLQLAPDVKDRLWKQRAVILLAAPPAPAAGQGGP